MQGMRASIWHDRIPQRAWGVGERR